MVEKDFDVAIIGSGPGGYVAAIRASQLGLNVVLVEKAEIGGVCLNWGCIPTKALLRSAEVYELVKRAKDFGIETSSQTLNIDNMVGRSKKVAEKLSSGVKFLLAKNKVQIIKGTGSLLSNTEIVIQKDNGENKEISARNIIIATGARPREISNLKVDGKIIWDYRHALRPTEIPKKLIIIGSGAIGIEFASFYNSMGSEVTVLEMLDRILPTEDKDVSNFAKKSFEQRGIRFFVDSCFEVVKQEKSMISLKIEQKGKKEIISANAVLVAAGIVGNLATLGLEKIGVNTRSGMILTNDFCKTNVANIFAIGDITSPPWLAHKASHEGVMVAEIIAGQGDVRPLKREHIPGCTYSNPQIASVGLTEDKALELGYEIKVGTFPFLANGKALAMGEDEGFIKTIFDKDTGELLGAHMVGSEVTELIATFLVGKELESTSEEFINTIFPHPTMSEMLHESVLSSEDKVIHL